MGTLLACRLPEKNSRNWPAGHQDTTGQDGAAITPVAVGNVAANQRREINQAGVAAVDVSGVGLVEQQGLDHEQDKDGAHAVVAEALPHLRDKEQIQPFGMGSGGHNDFLVQQGKPFFRWLVVVFYCQYFPAGGDSSG
jgi:hypothetical protein